MTPLELWKLNGLNEWLNRKDKNGVKLKDEDSPVVDLLNHRVAMLRGDYSPRTYAHTPRSSRESSKPTSATNYQMKPSPTVTQPEAVTVTTPTGDVKRFTSPGHADNWITYSAERTRYGRRH